MKERRGVFTRTARCAVSAAALLALVWAVAAGAREPAANPKRLMQSGPSSALSLDRSAEVDARLRAVAAPETTVIGSWTFDQGLGNCVAEGWTSIDITAQPGDFWHVDDFAGLGGGHRGLLYAPEGNQAMWCGLRPDPANVELCSYVALPGYGNSWDQSFRTVDCLDVLGDVEVFFLSTWDSEPSYDFTCPEFDTCDGNWIGRPAASGGYYEDCIDGWGSGAFSVTIPDSLHSGSVRIRLRFTSDGAWSDEDGLWDGDGAIIIDSLSVTDAGGAVIPTETFETEAVGEHGTISGNWTSEPAPGFGNFAALFNGVSVVQEDPCNTNTSCLWAFFSGSTADYACGGWPSQAAVPYANERGQVLNNEVWSPWMPWTGSGSEVHARFDVYRDLPIDPLIFYSYHMRWLVDGCSDGWVDLDFVNWGVDKKWYQADFNLSYYLPFGATQVQFALGAFDMCPFWCGSYGTGDCHSHAPLFDNVEILRINSQGPVYSVRDIDLFQDNFAADGTATGTVRADMAMDILPANNPNIVPGDSAVVSVRDIEVGLAADAYTAFGPAVYAYVGVWPQGQPGKDGPNLTQDPFRWPVVDSLTYNGDTWYCLRMDTSFVNGTDRTGPSPDRFCIDLNDNLFTPGDMVCFVFAATNNSATTRYYSALTGPTDDMAFALDNPMEFTCLPTGNADILYVDDANGLGAQPFVDTAFDYLINIDPPDRYDVRGPKSLVGNGPGSRVVNVAQQLVPFYRTIVWNSADVGRGTIGAGGYGTGKEKSDDFQMLHNFVHDHPNPGGVYISGDDVAEEWDGLTEPSAVVFRSTYMNFILNNGNHYAAYVNLSPFVIGEAGGCFDGPVDADSIVVFGGCPSINDFDVIQAGASSTVEATYGSGPAGSGAIVGQFTTNHVGQTVGVILSGFSFHEIRNVAAEGYLARAQHLGRILTCLDQPAIVSVDDAPLFESTLKQNYPNPFNPTTAIEFTVGERAPVTLRVYNVRGQLIRTLVDDERVPGVVHRIEWDGRNDAGQSVASGVYFYRLRSEGYTKTRKMVLLK